MTKTPGVGNGVQRGENMRKNSFLNYASLTGEFSHIRHRIFDNGMLQWSVIYEANHAILTVE